MQTLDFTPALAQTHAARASHREALDLLTPFLNTERSHFTPRQLASAALLIPTDARGSFRRAAMRLHRHNAGIGHRTPSADTLKRRLRAPQTTLIEAFMRNESRKILSKALRHNEARRGYDLIGDTTCHGHYGQAMTNVRADKDDPQYVSKPLSTSLARTATGIHTAEKEGTPVGHSRALAVLRLRSTGAVLPLAAFRRELPHRNLPHHVVGAFLDAARHVPPPRFIYFDREHDGADCIRLLNDYVHDNAHSHYVIFCKQTNPAPRAHTQPLADVRNIRALVKRLWDEGHARPVTGRPGEFYATTPYEPRQGSGVQTNLLTYYYATPAPKGKGWRVDWANRSTAYTYFTDIQASPETAARLHYGYRNRWSIETNTRTHKQNIGLSGSWRIEVRDLFFAIGHLLLGLHTLADLRHRTLVRGGEVPHAATVDRPAWFEDLQILALDAYG